MDLTDCDREPIHIPGTVQPFGVLFVLAEPSLTITRSARTSAASPFRVEEVWVGSSPCWIRVGRRGEGGPGERWYDMNPLQIGAHGKQFDGIVHRHQGAAILELEPNPGPPMGMRHPFGRRSADSTRVHVHRARGRRRSANAASHRVGTGLVLRFHEDGRLRRRRGQGTSAQPYLGCTIRPPTSAQARELSQNWLRHLRCSAKPARHSTPRGHRWSAGPQLSVLRSVSPIHLSTWPTWGRASMSISSSLRPPVGAHQPPEPPARGAFRRRRMACEFLGRLTSSRSQRSRTAPARRPRLASSDGGRAGSRDARERAGRQCARSCSRPKELMGMVGADGVAL